MTKPGIIVPNWPVPASVKSLSTTRQGGVSHGVYTSNNLALHVGDSVGDVQRNRANLVESLQIPGAIKWLTQIHGTVVVNHAEENGEADGSYADQIHQVCAVMTADCLPILLCDKSGKQVAAVHAGWRGLLDGVIESSLNKFYGEKSEILAWLGPGIGQSAFEVGAEVYDAFINQNNKAKNCFKPLKNDKYLADMVGLARLRLNLMGVDSIYGGEYCTFTDEKRFFSYRRDGVCGRMASLIWLDK